MNKYQMRQLPLSVAVGSVLAAGSLQAAVITVDSALDAPTGTYVDFCTLRAAIEATNTDTAVDGCAAGEPGLDQIIFDSTLVNSTITIAALANPFEIDDALTIIGPTAGSAAGIRISGADRSQVIRIEGAEPSAFEVVLDSMTLTEGVPQFYSSYYGGPGGAIYSNNADLVLRDAAVTDSYAPLFNGGGVSLRSGQLTLDNTSISQNSSGFQGFGGGLSVSEGSLSVTGGTISDNAGWYQGGGITVYNGSAELTNTEVSNNEILGNASGFGGAGGGVNLFSSNLTVTNSTIRDNVLRYGGIGAGIAGFDNGLVGSPGSTVTVINSEISGNSQSYNTGFLQSGAGISLEGGSLTMAYSSVVNNSIEAESATGGGIYGYGVDVDIDNSVISGNQIQSSSFMDADYYASRGGAGLSFKGGSLALSNSEVSNNLALGYFQDAGGLYLTDLPARLTNTTISGNGLSGVSPTVQVSTAMSMLGTGSAYLLHVTIDNNVDENDFARFSVLRDPTMNWTLINSIISAPAGFPTCLGQADTVIQSLSTTVSCTGIATSAVDLGLKPLADNGGFSRTHALTPQSVAVDDGIDCQDFGVLTDQRGVERDSNCDVGAFEFVDSIFLDRFKSALVL
jgi:hypothetical protein